MKIYTNQDTGANLEPYKTFAPEPRLGTKSADGTRDGRGTRITQYTEGTLGTELIEMQRDQLTWESVAQGAADTGYLVPALPGCVER